MAFTTAQGLALTRAAFGLYFVVSALRKTMTGWLTDGEQLTQFVERNLDGAAAGYGAFLQGVVIPNAGTFAQLVVLGEWITGISLLLGLLTRMGSIVGMWLMLNFMLAKGLLDAEGSNDRLFFIACFAFAAAAAGLTWGLDGALRPTLASNPVTRWLAGVSGPSRRAPAVWREGRREREEPRAA
jgi:thiosulfate dehydrogenase [quinone] large subunit